MPDAGAPTGLASRDTGLSTREVRFYESGLAARLPAGLRAPRLVGVDHGGPHTWLWLEDVGTALEDDPEVRRWRSGGALLRTPQLYLADRVSLERLLARAQGYAAYAHHVPAAPPPPGRAPTHPRWGALCFH